MKRSYHIYECHACIVVFGVEQAFEDQCNVYCPVCGTDTHMNGLGEGEMEESEIK
ncbi:hypothetical protein [Chengkuizengella axinellae]|uniref:Uncharacterized protein n=1 Tax=Chengkuizengella axinellae TaxID=3064388 RepID=A0ABT9IX97_9BACL|nr:hypothetical protein [Chengkuizengella sp. 2205SS18-9]MDP5273994.1 hypothetical protein [Chengkuizengella sp. 2205SS18-9]